MGQKETRISDKKMKTAFIDNNEYTNMFKIHIKYISHHHRLVSINIERNIYTTYTCQVPSQIIFVIFVTIQKDFWKLMVLFDYTIEEKTTKYKSVLKT